MNKKPIIYRYVTQVSRAFVSLFTTKAKAVESGAKMEEKLLSSGSEIDVRFVNFSNNNVVNKRSIYSTYFEKQIGTYSNLVKEIKECILSVNS